MKKFLIGLSFLNFAFSNAYATSSNEEEKVSITYRGKQYEVNPVDSSYAQMFKILTRPVAPQGELKELNDKFVHEVNQGRKELGKLQESLAQEIKKCEERASPYIEFRKFEYSETLGEDPMQPLPTLNTTISVRATTRQDSCAVQKCITKSSLALNSNILMELVKKNSGDAAYTSEQSQCINDMDENLKNFFQNYAKFHQLRINNQKESEKIKDSKEVEGPEKIEDSESTAYLLIDSSTIFTEGGKEDPEHKISLSNITLFPKDSTKALEALKQRELGVPAATTFTQSTSSDSNIPKIYSMFLYPPKGKGFNVENWGIKNSGIIAHGCTDKRE